MNVHSPAEVAEFLRANGMSALKQFGQNFLCDANILRKIAEAAVPEEGADVLEIGMGLGALTEALARRARKVVTVEIDRGLIETRRSEVEAAGNVKVVEGDILETDLQKIWESELEGRPFAVCGNLPYYITGRILLHVLECRLPVTRFTAMMQKEVAERLCCEPGSSEYGALTAYADYFCEPRILFTVSKRCFYPAPDVSSAVVLMDLANHERPDVPYELYKDTVRAAFAMRRKTVLNNLKQGIGPQAGAMLEAAGIPAVSRAQELSAAQFAAIAQARAAADAQP